MKINIRLKKDVPPALIAKLQEELGEYTFAWKEDIPILTVSVFQKRKTIEVLKKLELLDDSLNSERRRQDLYRGRYGILFGFLLFFFVLFLSGERVWTVEVKGNDLVSEERILKMLEIEGIYPGASGNVSYPALASNCVANNPEISWMSIGRHGTTVTCVVMEAKAEEQEDTDVSAS